MTKQRSHRIASRALARRTGVVIALALAAAGCISVAQALPVAYTERVSVAYDGAEVTYDPIFPAISGDGSVVAFSANSLLLAPPFDLDNEQVYVRDLDAGTIELASKNASGGASDGNVAREAAVSRDGRFVAFTGTAKNLVPEVTSTYSEVFVKDRVSGEMLWASPTTAGAVPTGYHASQRPSLSAEGRYVAFESNATSLTADGVGGSSEQNHIYVRDMETSTTVLADVSSIGVPATYSWLASIDASGSHVVFCTYQQLTVDDKDTVPDVYVRHLHNNTTERVSKSTKGVSGTGGYGAGDPHISANGRYVVFQSDRAGLVSNDTNGKRDVFVRDLKLHTTKRVSVTSSGKQLAKGAGERTDISATGRYVIFNTTATELFSIVETNTAQVVIKDVLSGATKLVSKTMAGGWAEEYSDSGCISDDGSVVAFSSASASLVPTDTNGISDIFVRRDITPLVRTKPVLSRTPTGTSRSHRRSHGVAKFSMSLKVSDIGGDPIAGATVKLQRFSNRTYTWQTYATLTTGSTGIARKYFSAKKRGTTYYRWYVPATGTHYSRTLSEQRIIIK